jgi:hypothetical protein
MRELRLVLLGIAAVIALLLGSGFLIRAVRGPPAPQPDAPSVTSEATPAPTGIVGSSRAAIEHAIAETPDYTRFFDRLRLVFPSDYDIILNGLAGSYGLRKDIDPDMLMVDAVAALKREKGSLASKASDQALATVFSLQLEEMTQLGARDPHLCVAFLYGANGNGFLGFAADHRPLIADAAIAGLDAMNSGRMDKVDRGAPSDADFQTLDQGLVEKGLTRPQIEALLDGKTPDPPIADTAMCEAGKVYLKTLAGLPPDARARLYGLAAGLMAKS